MKSLRIPEEITTACKTKEPDGRSRYDSGVATVVVSNGADDGEASAVASNEHNDRVTSASAKVEVAAGYSEGNGSVKIKA